MHKQNLYKKIKNQQQQTYVLWNLESPKVIWEHITWEYIQYMK
jgi:hypothetical protein